MKTLSVLLAGIFVCVASAQQQITVSGKLMGHDGKTIAQGHVHLLQPGVLKPVTTTAVAQDGSFQLAGATSGLAFLEFTGVNHASQRYFVVVEKPMKLELDVRLGSYPYLSEFKEVSIIGDFNDFNFSTAKKMEKQTDGTYAAEFETTAEKFKYQLLGVTSAMRSVNGTQSEDYEYDGGGDYRSIVTPKNGKVKVIFDPRKIVQSTMEPSISARNDRLMNKFFALQVDMHKREQAFSNAWQAHQKAGKDPKEFSYDWSSDLTHLTSEIGKEKEPLLRKMLLWNYLWLTQGGARTLDKGVAKLALDEIEFSSPLWSINPMALRVAVSSAGLNDEYDTYLEEFLQQNPDKNAKATLLFNEAMNAKFSNDTEKFKKYYDLLVKDYGDTPLGKKAKSKLSPDSKVAVGKPVPSFSLASMEDPKKVYTKESMKGKYYLIDFWAVWCGPCIAEMDNLHKAYEKFKTRNFGILSLSFDPKPEDVVKFRKDKWKMPWLHSFIEKGFDSPAAKEFEVIGIPKPILVDPEGKIVAMESDLRGENLEKTLSRFLKEAQ